MAIIEKNSRRAVINLTGPDGNAFALMGYAIRFGRQIYTEDEVDKILEDMQSGDYENLIKVFDDNFGMVVDLER